MTDVLSAPEKPVADSAHSLYHTDTRTRRRNAAEARFRFYGLAAIGIGILSLAVLLTSIMANGVPAFLVVT